MFGNVPEAVCFSGAVRDVDPAYAIIRVDLDVEDDDARFTVLALSGARSWRRQKFNDSKN